MSSIDNPLYQISIKEYELRKKREEARQLKPLPLDIVPPEGYYYTAEDYQKYKQEAMAYNKRLNQYKQELTKAWLEVKEAKLSIAEYDRLFKNRMVELERQAPQREAFLKYIQSYGPPEPTPEQRRRQELGYPQTQPPGPAAGPKPGSIGEQLQQSTRQTIGIMEAPFRAVTDPLRSTAILLEQLSHQVLQTQRPYQPREAPGTMPNLMLTDRFMVPSEARPDVGLLAYGYSVGLDVAAGAFDIATFEARPGLIAETTGSVLQLATDEESRRAAYQKIVSDPFRFLAVSIGAPMLGVPGFAAEVKRILSADYSMIIPKAVSKTRQVYAQKKFDLLGLDEELFTQFEREVNLAFPEETTGFTSTQTLYKRGTVKTSKGKLDYFLETSPEAEGLLTEIDIPDTWSPTQVNKATENFYALASEEKGGSMLVRGKSGMKPFKETTVKATPRNEAVMLSKAPPMMQVSEIKSSFFTSTIIEEITEFFPGVNLKTTLLDTAKVNIPSFAPALSKSAILSITTTKTAPQQATKQTTEQAIKDIQNIGSLTMPKIDNLLTPKGLQSLNISPVQTPKMEPIQEPKTIQFTVPKMEATQITTPKQTVIVPPIVPQMTQSPKPRARVKAEPSKKKKKKRGKKRKSAYERRIDPLKIIIPKMNIKVPKI